MLYDNENIKWNLLNNIGRRWNSFGKTTGLSVKNINDNDTVTKFVLNKVLQHVGLSWIIETNQQLEYDIHKHNPNWITDGPWYNTYICTKFHGTVLENIY